MVLSSGEIAEIDAVSKFLTHTQRASCDRDVRFDGSPIVTDTTGTYGWVDALLKPDMIAGAEVYSRDLPPEIDPLQDRPASKPSAAVDGRCVTLIWTK
jgi:hypothetical protein